MRVKFINKAAGVINVIDVNINDIESVETSGGFKFQRVTITFKDKSKETFFIGDRYYDDEKVLYGSKAATPEEIETTLKEWETNLPVGCYRNERELRSAIDKSK